MSSDPDGEGRLGLDCSMFVEKTVDWEHFGSVTV